MPKLVKDLLADTYAKNSKPKDKPYPLRDGDGLWLVVEPTEKNWWKLRTIFAKKKKSFSLGESLTVTLSDGREKRDVHPALTRRLPGKARRLRPAAKGALNL